VVWEFCEDLFIHLFLETNCSWGEGFLFARVISQRVVHGSALKLWYENGCHFQSKSPFLFFFFSLSLISIPISSTLEVLHLGKIHILNPVIRCSSLVLSYCCRIKCHGFSASIPIIEFNSYDLSFHVSFTWYQNTLKYKHERVRENPRKKQK
jgi:hypothetical protein